MKFFLIVFVMLGILEAEFLSFGESIPPAKEEVLGEEIVVQPSVRTPQKQLLGEEIITQNKNQVNQDSIQRQVYKEIRVEDLRGYGEFKIALLVPRKVIKGYSKKVANSILSYLIYKNKDFTFEVFDSGDESEANLYRIISNIGAKGYKFVIAPLTLNGVITLSFIEQDLFIYVPTINKNLLGQSNGNFYFGGIDYKRQLNKLLSKANPKLAIFMDRSEVASRLTSYIENRSYQSNIYTKLIANLKVNPKYILKGNTRLQNASIFFNMPLISTALLVSSFSSYDIKPYAIFSTQINYSPKLFTMIQRKDRKNFYLANSIGYVNSKLDDIDKNLGIKLKYSWVAYSSSVGLDYIFSRFYGIDQIFNEDMISHQIAYRVGLEKIVKDRFEKVH